MISPDLFGAPCTDAHSVRFAGLAVVDVLATIVAAWVISRAFDASFLVVLAILLIVAEALHLAIGVKTGFLVGVGLVAPDADAPACPAFQW